MSDFKGEDYDFAVGTIKGLRSWSIDDKGRLRGVTHTAIWKPGENVAECRSTKRTHCPKYEAWLSAYFSVPGPPEVSPRPAPCGIPGCNGQDHPVVKHSFDPECQCGFWAYDEAGFEEHGDVVGVIEGYGRTTIGTKGFRCEKARIVALCRETRTGLVSLSEWLRLKELYPAADFFDDLDDMVLAHGQVMRTWPAVDEDFWTEVAEPPLTVSAYLTANVGSYQAAMAQFNQLAARPTAKRNPFLFGGGGS